MIKGIFLVILCISFHSVGFAGQHQVKQDLFDTVKVTAYGITPNSRANAVPAIQRALKVCKLKKNPLLFFPKGRYDLWPQHAIEKVYYESNTSDNNPKRNGILLEGQSNLTIDGNDAAFIYHNRMQPITVEKSTNILIKNLNIDWDIPLTAQARVIDTTATYITIMLDEKQYPYEIDAGKLSFIGEGWKSGVKMVMEYEYDSHLIAAGTGDDHALGKGWQNYRAEKLQNGTLRLYHSFKRRPKPGNVLIFRHSDRDHAGIFITESKNIKIEHLNLYHCAGLGILSQFSENLSFMKVNIIPNSKKGRYFSGHDDGMHFSSCKGQILVDNCKYEGLMDDPINVHGIYVKVIKKLGTNQLLCRFMERMSVGMVWARKGDHIGFTDNASLKTLGKASVTAFKQISTTDFEITLTTAIPIYVKEGLGLENLTWTPSATIRNSTFESCRARGILVTTPKDVLIENNIFRSSGSAILIAGDVNSWYESGAVSNVVIKGNTFLAPVLTSNYQFSEAIISIFPEIPIMNQSTPTYHRNIQIINNNFNPYDYPILFAQSVQGLIFENNTLTRSYDFSPFHKRKVGFSLIGCKAVEIRNNKIDQNLLGKNISIQHMQKSDVSLIQPELYFDK
ncbi:right-handed parallel beta-helix repeat-containing protein [Pedobacter heparinus]|uniref:right-handed parallel beta-helix repeat-containing protein n=1 Tax=Pedobacter heparinus TaxID=984 RepID=UPI00292D7E81|nr:right-handed parallel beta-helix repeat-containing protein [Pedobacter heparinus]